VQLLKLQKVVKKEVGNIRMSVAMFLGSQDHTISLTNALSVYNQLPTREKLFHIYGNSSHCLILDHQADLIARDTIQFIQNTIIQKTE
jgi:esterase/lipase